MDPQEPTPPRADADVPADALAAPIDHGRWYQWLPLLLPVLGIALVYAAEALGWRWFTTKYVHEPLALIFTPTALLLAVWRLHQRRAHLELLLAVFCVVVVIREINFPGAKPIFYASLAALAVWSALWFKPLKKAFWGRPKGRWITIAGWGYVMALLVQRRAFRFLPNEANIHVLIEEPLESIAHVLLIVAAAI